MRPTLVASALALSLAACAPPAPPPSTPPPEVVTGSSEIAPASIAAGTLDRFVGSYRSGAETLLIARLGSQLTVDMPGPVGPQPLKMVGLGTFTDGAGTAYLFTLPPDGFGALLQTQGSGARARQWQRFP